MSIDKKPKIMRVTMRKGSYGISGITFTEIPDGYSLVEYQAGENGEVTETHHFVSHEIIKHIWKKVILSLQIGEEHHIREIAEKIINSMTKDDIEKLMLTESVAKKVVGQWNRTSGYKNNGGVFDYATFNGNRASNFNLAYYPLKTLDALWLISYPERTPKITRKMMEAPWETTKKGLEDY